MVKIKLKKTSLHGRRLNHINTNISTDIFQGLSVQSTRVHKMKNKNKNKNTRKQKRKENRTEQKTIYMKLHKNQQKNINIVLLTKVCKRPSRSTISYI